MNGSYCGRLGKILLPNNIWPRMLNLTPEALWVFVGQAGTIVAGLVGIKILTHVLDPSEFGRLALANTLVALIGTNLFGPLGQGLLRFWSISKDRGELEKFYAISNRYTKFIIYIVFLLTVVLALVFGVTKGSNWTILLTLSLIVGAITGWLGLRVSIFTAARQRQRVALLKIGNAFFRPAIAAFLVILIASNASWAMAGYFLATFLILVITECLYRRTISEKSLSSLTIEQSVASSQNLGREILSFSWPFFVWGIFGWIHLSCDRWSLQAYYGTDVVGPFAVVSQLAVYPLIFGSTFLSNLFTPIAFQRAGKLISHQSVTSANKILGAITGIYIVGAIILIALFATFHHSLVSLISNVNFIRFSHLLPGLTTAWAFFYLGQMLSSFGLLAKKPQSYILPKLVSAIVAGISTFYLSARIGPVGVVWGLALAGFLYALWCAIIAIKLVRHPMHFIK